jgi:hypothetical protein
MAGHRVYRQSLSGQADRSQQELHLHGPQVGEAEASRHQGGAQRQTAAGGPVAVAVATNHVRCYQRSSVAAFLRLRSIMMMLSTVG